MTCGHGGSVPPLWWLAVLRKGLCSPPSVLFDPPPPLWWLAALRKGLVLAAALVQSPFGVVFLGPLSFVLVDCLRLHSFVSWFPS